MRLSRILSPSVRRLLPLLLVMIGSWAPALAAGSLGHRPGDPPAGQPKAIDSYQQAFDWWKANSQGEQATLSPAELLILSDGLHGSPSAEVRQALAKAAPYIDLLRAGGRTREYGLELDRSKGFALTLQHLSSLRNATRVLRLDAEVRLADGDAAGAVEGLEAIAGFASHSRQDRILVSSLVSGAIIASDDVGLDRALGSGLLTPELAGRLADALEPMRGTDPIGVADSIRGEAELMRTSVEQALKEGQSIESLLGAEPGTIDPAELTGDRLQTQFATIGSLCDRAADAIGNPDRDAARQVLAEIDEIVESGEAGVLAKLLLPAIGRAAESTWRTEDMIAARWTALNDLRLGKTTAAALANAAVAYLRIAELVRSLGKEECEAVEAVRLAGRAVDEHTLARAERTLEALRPRLRSLFRDAARASRCDFSISHEPTPALIPPYLLGVRGGVRILMADAAMAVGRPTAPVAGPRAAPGPKRDGQPARPAEGGTDAKPGTATTSEGATPEGSAATANASVAEANADTNATDALPFSDAEAAAAALRAARHLSVDPAIGHAAFASFLLGDAALILDEAAKERRIDARRAEELVRIASTIVRSDPAQFAKAMESDRGRLAKRLSFEVNHTPSEVEEELRKRGDGITQAMLMQQLADLIASAASTSANGNPSQSPDEAAKAKVVAPWLDDDLRRTPLVGLGEIVPVEAVRSSMSLLDEVRAALVDGEKAGRDPLLSILRRTWVDALGLDALRSSASNSLRTIDDRLGALVPNRPDAGAELGLVR